MKRFCSVFWVRRAGIFFIGSNDIKTPYKYDCSFLRHQGLYPGGAKLLRDNFRRETWSVLSEMRRELCCCSALSVHIRPLAD